MYQYKSEDADCKYCAEWRHRRCQAAGCPWLSERVEARAVSYVIVVLKLFRNVKDADIVRRIGQMGLNFRASERGESHAILLPCTCSAQTSRCSSPTTARLR